MEPVGEAYSTQRWLVGALVAEAGVSLLEGEPSFSTWGSADGPSQHLMGRSDHKTQLRDETQRLNLERPFNLRARDLFEELMSFGSFLKAGARVVAGSSPWHHGGVGQLKTYESTRGIPRVQGMGQHKRSPKGVDVNIPMNKCLLRFSVVPGIYGQVVKPPLEIPRFKQPNITRVFPTESAWLPSGGEHA